MGADAPGITSFSAEAIFFLTKIFFLLLNKGNFDTRSDKSHFK